MPITKSGGTREMGVLLTEEKEFSNSPTTSRVDSVIATSTSWTRTSSVTPGYRSMKKKDRRGLAPLPFYFHQARDTTTQGRYYRVRLSDNTFVLYQGSGWEGGYTSGAPFFTGISDFEKNSAAAICGNKLLAKLKSQHVNLANLFAERAKTAQMVGDTALKLFYAARNLKRGNFGAAAENLGVATSRRSASRGRRHLEDNSPQGLANAWLELQYGWKPLLNDVYGSCEALAERYMAETMIKRATASHTVQGTDSFTSISPDKPYASRTWTMKSSRTVRMGAAYRVDGPALHSFASLGITNPLTVAWEVTPFSFVVDWFLPVGNFLDTLDATLGLSYLHGYTTIFDRHNGKKVYSEQGLDAFNRMIQAYGVAYYEDLTCTRNSAAGFPAPSLPRFKNPLSMGHMHNALALLTQAFSGKSR